MQTRQDVIDGSSVKRAPVAATAGAQSFGSRAATRPLHGCIPYLERDTSTTLSIKAAKAHIAPKATHASARLIDRSPLPDGHTVRPGRPAAPSRRRMRAQENRFNANGLIFEISILAANSGRDYFTASPFSISCRIASDREGLGAAWRSIQAAIAASSSSGQRTVRTGSRPVRGRPRGLFSVSAIDPPL